MAAEPLAYEATGYEVVESEPPELLGRNLVSSSYLLAGATAFFFIAFVFAYFYLRSVNNGGMWKPKGVDASVGWGTAVIACYVVSALLLRLGLTDHRALRRRQWRQKGGLALLAGLVGLVLQVLAWTHESFGPADGGFASVYFGWTAFLFLFVFATLLWLEMTLATSLRYRKIETGAPGPGPGEASGDPHRVAHDISDPLSLVRAELVGLSFYWTFLTGIAVVSWIVLYLI
jgi:heme/copper-type cytochrome/quinol oxidase subunit 3